jgi:dephospho-CoA kinase
MSATSRPLVIGLTGGIASGKSTVGKILRQLGAEVIDADEVARAVVAPGRPAYEKLVETFGREILKPADPSAPEVAPAIDRERLAALVFNDESARQELNAITHPEIAAESAQRIVEIGERGGIAIYEATLLVENKVYRGLDGLIVVDIPEALQLDRAHKRGLPLEQAEARMRAQARRVDRLALANWVIDNQGDEGSTREQVQRVWEEIQRGEVPPRTGAA